MSKNTQQPATKNPYSEMGFIRFWLISTAFCATFPLSFLLCLVFMGPDDTRALVHAIVMDYLSGLLFKFIALIGLVWLVWYTLL